jgi:hypothetical protein
MSARRVMPKGAKLKAEVIWLAVDEDGYIIDTWTRGTLAMPFREWRKGTSPNLEIRSYALNARLT